MGHVPNYFKVPKYYDRIVVDIFCNLNPQETKPSEVDKYLIDS